MRLRKIKLAGFKSFVDPTTLIIPGNLVGIVGPNGCGKSNIIDAVTWVMGESSAKHLRGENLTDVIFNGSNLRQPVGQASVELVFDNSENKVGGQYSSYNEISIRRQITREGISIYFLNGARCRRKDIQSLFLGTGLGPRSYAIIEQGMISRLIEAKPEELRSFIEEAAGISRYRERRRETEHRIRHTRENLNRLNDIREELAKQLAHLQRQAKAAERYQALKQEERRYKSELLALQWRDLRDLADARAATVREHENRVERAIAELRAVESEIARRREGFSLANEEHSRAQSRYYEVGGVISQIEQKIQHADERVRALQEHIAGTAAARQAEAAQLQHDHGKLAELADELQALEPRLRGSRSENVGAHDVLNEAEQAIQGWQSEWDSFNETVSGISRQLEVDGARARFLEEGLEDIAERRSQLMQELEAADTGALETELAELGARQSACDTAAAGARVELQTRQAGLRALRTALEEAVDQLSSSRAAYQAAQAELASIESVLQGASPGGSEQVRAWLQATGLDQAPRIVDELEVDPAWSLAVETVLGHRLQDVCVEDLESRATQLSGLRNGRVGMISVRAQPDRGEDRYPRLAGKLSEDSVVHPLLADVFVADNLKRALQMRGDLQDGESVVTRDGTWIGRHWILANRPAADQEGILSGEYRLEDLRNRRSALDRQITGQEEVVAGQRRELVLAEEAAESAQQRLHA
ncbi:MAG: chromosome segregation protein SMC, partial [Gammaproteobacteria bacterium]|nr:chromosome segregation protein SMC [Gammaproteobacteria bacterium]